MPANSPESSFPPEIQASLDQADVDLAEGRTRRLTDVLGELTAAEAYPDADRDMDGWVVDADSVQTYISEHGEPHVRGSE